MMPEKIWEQRTAFPLFSIAPASGVRLPSMRDARVLLPHPFEPRIVVQPSWKDRDRSSKREKDEDGYEKEIFDSVT